MKNNSILTYVLYALLVVFIMAAGYYACQKQKEKKAAAEREAQQMEETLRNMGYNSEEDTLASSGSSYVSHDSTSKPVTTTTGKTATNGKTAATGKTTKPSVSASGIEEDPHPATSIAKKSTTAAAPAKSLSTTTAKPKTPATTKGVSAVAGPGAGRWAVRAGTFAYKDGARRRLEEVIKAGYPNAEISATKDGKSAVVVFRSNDKAAAIRVADKLEEKGIDAAVFDRH